MGWMEAMVNFVLFLLIHSCIHHSFTHLFNNFLLNSYYIPGTYRVEEK